SKAANARPPALKLGCSQASTSTAPGSDRQLFLSHSSGSRTRRTAARAGFFICSRGAPRRRRGPDDERAEEEREPRPQPHPDGTLSEPPAHDRLNLIDAGGSGEDPGDDRDPSEDPQHSRRPRPGGRQQKNDADSDAEGGGGPEPARRDRVAGDCAEEPRLCDSGGAEGRDERSDDDCGRVHSSSPSSGSDPKRRTWPSGSSTWNSSAHGKFSGGRRIFAPAARYSSWSAAASS